MRTVQLGEIADIDRWGVDPTSVSPDTRYLGLEHIERGGRIIGSSTVADAELKSTKFRFTSDHVLYGKLRPNLGKISRPAFTGVCSTDILPIRPGENLDRNYLAHYLSQKGMVDFAASQATGANLPRLNPSVLASFPIPLPGLDEQRRIASILDHADALRTKRRQALAHLDSLTQSIFHEMFGEPSHWPQRWSMKQIGQLGTVITGRTPSTSKPGMFDGPIPFVTPGDLGSGKPVVRSVTNTGAVASRTVRTGATFVCCIGATIGKVDQAKTTSAFNQQINAVEWQDLIEDDFGLEALRSTRPTIVARGASTTLPLLAKSQFSKLFIPTPPVQLQRKFSERRVTIQYQKEQFATALTLDNQLFASLQSRAFRGEL